jgi:hypothetical protein
VRTFIVFIALSFVGCSHRLALVYETGDAVTQGTQFIMQPSRYEATASPRLPEIKNNETTLSAENRGLFAPGKQPF